jgi:MoaA/NifB/PqqE/SkfB family radical SAM enzyme
MFNVTTLQRYIPASLKNALKPYYRSLFPNQLMVLIWPTFRCNYECSYCPVVTWFNMASIYPKECERPPADWIDAMSRLPKANIYFSGGEPFLYRGLPDVINGLVARHNILGVVTNGTVNVSEYDKIKNPIHLNISYHREFVAEDKFVAKIQALRDLRKFHINVNIVATRENLPVLERVSKLITDRRVSLHVDPYIDPGSNFRYTREELALLTKYLEADRLTQMDRLEFNDYAVKTCSAGQNYINVMPDGTVFRCAGGFEYYFNPIKQKLLTDPTGASHDSSFFRMGNLFDSTFMLESPTQCPLPCLAACDRDMATIKLRHPSPKRPSSAA